MSKIVICGSRGCTEDIETIGLWSEVNKYLVDYEGRATTDVIISGGAKGADTYAKKIAEESSIPYEEFLPDWDTHGKKAGYLRNITMLEQDGVDMVLALWDGESKGTKHTIDAALRKGIDLRVIFYKDWMDD